MMNIFELDNYVFAIFGGELQNDVFIPKDVFGTASRLSEFTFISTAHTIINASSYDSCAMGIALPGMRQLHFELIDEFELFEKIDLATFSIFNYHQYGHLLSFKLSFKPLNMLDDVVAVGFPHGLDNINQVLKYRALKGHIVNHGPFYRFDSRPVAYELSFNCPRGISGAPLMKYKESDSAFNIHGYIIGNTKVEMTVFSEREVTNNGERESVYEKTETTNLGIAIDSVELKDYILT